MYGRHRHHQQQYDDYRLMTRDGGKATNAARSQLACLMPAKSAAATAE